MAVLRGSTIAICYAKQSLYKNHTGNLKELSMPSELKATYKNLQTPGYLNRPVILLNTTLSDKLNIVNTFYFWVTLYILSQTYFSKKTTLEKIVIKIENILMNC